MIYFNKGLFRIKKPNKLFDLIFLLSNDKHLLRDKKNNRCLDDLII